jgi:hypothetical protein
MQVIGPNAVEVFRYSSPTGNSGPDISLARSASNTVGTVAAVAATDELGSITFRGAGNETTFVEGASITAAVESGTISGSSLPTRLVFSTTADGASSPTERLRIDSSGNLLVGTTSSAISSAVGLKFLSGAGATPQMGIVQNTDGNDVSSYHLFNTNATNNGYRFFVTANGGIYNFSGNNVNLSDERTKTNIELAGRYLDKICAIPVKLFNYKDEAEGEQRTLGVIAQDVEAVAPEFVNNDGWKGTAPEDGVPLKTVYTTDLMFGMMKAVQEQQAIINDLKARVEALEGAQG